MSQNNFAEQLKNLRKAANLTQAQFAEQMDVHLQTVSKWERGISEPDIAMLGDIARLFGISVGQLIAQNGETPVAGNFDAAAFGSNVAKLRHAAGEDQKTLAKALSVSADTVSKWERAKICPDIDSLVAISKRFSVPISALYCGKAAPTAKTPPPKSKRSVLWSIVAAVAVCVVIVGAVLGVVFAGRPAQPQTPVADDPSGLPSATPNPPVEQHVCDFGEWVVKQPPTCTQAGEKVRTCTVCNAEEQDFVPATGHSYKQTVVPPTCTAQGYTTNTCATCGNSYKSDFTDKAAHSYEQTVVSPTCTAQGYTTNTCATCGNSYKSDFTDKAAHSYEQTVVPPSCTEQGYTLHVCSVCKDEYKDSFLPAAHTWQILPAREPTCTESGVTEGKRCSVCRFVAVQQRVVSPLGHDIRGGACSRCNFQVVATDESLFNFQLLPDGTYKILPKSGVTMPEEVVFPWQHNGADVTELGLELLRENCNVKSVVLPATLRKIVEWSCCCNKNLQAVYYLGNLEQWLNVEIEGNNFLFAHALYLGGVLLENLSIPNGVTVVKANHFNNCSGLLNIELPDSVVEVESRAFDGCINVQRAVIPYTVVTMGEYAFSEMTHATIYCEVAEQPAGWHQWWSYYVDKVVWSYVPEAE